MSAEPNNSPAFQRHDPPFTYVGGADHELGNFIEGADLQDACAGQLAAILAEIDGVRDDATLTAYTPVQYASELYQAVHKPGRKETAKIDPVDYGRKYLATNGGCIYVDMGHIEVALPEFTRAKDFVAYWHASLRIVRRAQLAAGAKLPAGQQLHVLVGSSDGLGNSYGQHLNFGIPRRTFDGLFHHKFQWALFLAAYQVSSIIFTGQGKVGAENGRVPVQYQLSARADFFEHVFSHATTVQRGILNLRDEPLCGVRRYYGEDPQAPARLHAICFDANLAPVACYLKFGVLQIIFDMISAECIDTSLILDDPVRAFVDWSHDVSLTTRMETLQGECVTALELQQRFFNAARSFIDAGQCRVPDATAILNLWGDTLAKLQAGDYAALAGRCDWLLKLSAIQAALKKRPDLSFASPEIKYLDHLYGSLDPDSGIFWSFQRAGRVEPVVSESDIAFAQANPPEDTRAWTRAMLLRMAGRHQVDAMNWDFIRFTFHRPGRSPCLRTLDMSAPLKFSRGSAEPHITAATSLSDCLDWLGAPSEDPHYGYSAYPTLAPSYTSASNPPVDSIYDSDSGWESPAEDIYPRNW